MKLCYCQITRAARWYKRGREIFNARQRERCWIGAITSSNRSCKQKPSHMTVWLFPVQSTIRAKHVQNVVAFEATRFTIANNMCGAIMDRDLNAAAKNKYMIEQTTEHARLMPCLRRMKCLTLCNSRHNHLWRMLTIVDPFVPNCCLSHSREKGAKSEQIRWKTL